MRLKDCGYLVPSATNIGGGLKALVTDTVHLDCGIGCVRMRIVITDGSPVLMSSSWLNFKSRSCNKNANFSTNLPQNEFNLYLIISWQDFLEEGRKSEKPNELVQVRHMKYIIGITVLCFLLDKCHGKKLKTVLSGDKSEFFFKWIQNRESQSGTVYLLHLGQRT